MPRVKTPRGIGSAAIFAISPGTTIKTAYTAAAAASTAVPALTTLVRIITTTDAYVAVGANPTATTSDLFVPAKTAIFLMVNPGDKVSAIRDAADGNCFVTPANPVT